MDIGAVGQAGFIDESIAPVIAGESYDAMPPGRLRDLLVASRRDDASESMILETLQELSTLPTAQRVSALADYASHLFAPPMEEDNFVDAAWSEVLRQAFQDIENVPSLEERGHLHSALDVAMWHCDGACGLDDRAATERGLYADMRRLPPQTLPTQLDAAVARGRTLDWPELAATVRDTDICFPAVSDRLAAALASQTIDQMGFGMDVLDVLKNRFGITEKQLSDVVYPAEANRLAETLADERGGYWSALDAHPFKDPAFTTHVLQALLQDRFAAFHAEGASWRSMTADDPLSTPAENAQWAQLAIDFVRNVEANGYTAVWAAAESDAAYANADGSDTLMQAITGMTEAMKTAGQEARVFETNTQLPLGFQPIAMDRWAELVTALPDPSTARAQIPAMKAWREQVVQQFTEQGDSVNAARAFTAEMRALRNLADPVEESPAARDLALQALSTMPIEASGAMLSALCEFAALDMAVISDRELTDFMTSFLEHPGASMTVPSRAFVGKMMGIAGSRLDRLPTSTDNASQTVFDQLCTRFSVPHLARPLARSEFLMAIGNAIPAHPVDLRHAIDQELTKAGFDGDDEAIAQVLNTARARIGAARIAPDAPPHA